MEADSPSTADQKPPKLRWFQYRLRSLFVLTTVVAIACSWLTVTMQNQRKQRAAADAIEKAGGDLWCELTWLGRLLRDDSLVEVGSVNISRKSITNVLLVNLQGLSQVTVLDLSGTGVNDTGLGHLQGLTQLRWLDLHSTEVTDAGLRHLQGLTQLRWLDLRNTQVTDEGDRKLQQALPNCMIDR